MLIASYLQSSSITDDYLRSHQQSHSHFTFYILPDCDPNLRPSTTAELGHLVDRLEKIIERLERTVSARELATVNGALNAVIQKTDSEELDSLPLPLPPSTPNFDLLIGDIAADSVNDNFPLLNGKKITIDLENLPTVIDHTDEYLTQDEPDYSPPTSMSVLGYQDIVSGPLFEYLNLSKKIGGDVAKHAESVERAFNAQLAYVTLASSSAQPSPADQQRLLKPTSDEISSIQEYREKNRTSPFFNHLSAISESIPALGWVCVVSFDSFDQSDSFRLFSQSFSFSLQRRDHMSKR